MRALVYGAMAAVVVGLSLLAAGCGGSDGAGGPVGWAVGKPDAGYGVILHTTDGGRTWVRQGSPAEIPNVEISDVSAVDNRTAWAVGGAEGLGVILYTSDGGRTWTRQTIPTDAAGEELSGIKAVSPSEAWACAAGGVILHTTDAGRTWVMQNTPAIPPSNFQRLDAVGSGAVWVVGDKGGTDYPVVEYSTDRGAQWTRQGGPGIFSEHLIDVSALSPLSAWAVGGSPLGPPGQVVCRTLDGSTWTQVISLDPGDANGVCAVNPSTVWVVTDFDGIHKTTDGGATWTKQTVPRTGFYLLGVTAINEQQAWVTGGSTENRGIILHTTDGGATWTEQAFPTETWLRRVSFVGARR